MNARPLTFTVLLVALAACAAAQTPAPPGPRAAPTPRERATQAPPRAPAAPAPPATPAAPAAAVAPPPPPPPPAPPPSTPTPRRENQSTNIRIELTVTDERPGAAPITKSVSLVTGDGLSGSVRSQTNYSGLPGGGVPFNVDAMPIILADGKIHTRLTLQYDVPPPAGPPEAGSVRLLQTSLRDSIALTLENGKPMVAVQSTDPVTDRKVSVEVKATIVR